MLDIGGTRGDIRSWLAVGALLFDDAGILAGEKEYSEPAFWLLGRNAYEGYRTLNSRPVDCRLSSRSLPDSGYYILQSGRRGEPVAGDA